MKWGETQSLLSVIIGLNLAYFAFRELRAPYLTTIARNIEHLNGDILNIIKQGETNQKAVEFSQLLISAIQLKSELTVFVWGLSSRRFDNLLGVPSVIVATMSVVMLVISTLKFEDTLSSPIFWITVIVGFLPVAGHIVANYVIVAVVGDRFGAKYTLLLDRFHELVTGYSSADK